MTTRQLLLVAPPDRITELASAVSGTGWEIRNAGSIAAAQGLANQRDLLVGMVVLEPGGMDVYEIERLTTSHTMEWVAVVTPETLRNPAWAKLTLENFFDHHTLPFDSERLAMTLGHAHGRAELKHNLNRRKEWAGRYQMIGKSQPMLNLYAKLDRVTKVDAPVLISGESGTGKELIARAIHKYSFRAKGPFVPVNCAALPDNLVHSELFGHEKGAFTGAYQRKIGSIESAAGGVIFLDEIGDLPLDLQTHLLRFLQERVIVRLGTTERIPIDVRVIAATHVDLQKAVQEKRFREDLFYRLHVLQLRVPPLRERGVDMDLFIEALMQEFAGEKNPAVQGFSQDALRVMREHTWPGNVRELMNRVHQAMIMSENRLITPEDLGLTVPDEKGNVVTLSSARAAAERGMIEHTLRVNSNNVSRAARELGVSRVTLYRLMEKFDIDVERRG